MNVKGTIKNGQSNYIGNIGKTRHRTKTNKQMINQSEKQKNRQTKTQNETQHRKPDEQIESEQTPMVTQSEWEAVPTSYKTTSTLMI
jgi:hypothetical protein